MATKKARILVSTRVDDTDYQPNQVIEADADVIKSLVKSGNADDSAAGIAYCIESEGATVIKHETAAAPAAAEEPAPTE